jgi:hypothetical protein
MFSVLSDAEFLQVPARRMMIPWTPDDDLPPSADFDIEPDWDAAFDRPSPEDQLWWAQQCDERDRLELNGPFEPTDADWDEMARWSEWLDMKERESRYTEDDARAAGLAIG